MVIAAGRGDVVLRIDRVDGRVHDVRDDHRRLHPIVRPIATVAVISTLIVAAVSVMRAAWGLRGG